MNNIWFQFGTYQSDDGSVWFIMKDTSTLIFTKDETKVVLKAKGYVEILPHPWCYSCYNTKDREQEYFEKMLMPFKDDYIEFWGSTHSRSTLYAYHFIFKLTDHKIEVTGPENFDEYADFTLRIPKGDLKVVKIN